VALMDNQTYTYERLKTDVGSLIISIVIMSRAHEESETKRKRVAAAKDKKRERARAGEVKFTRLCPEWLRPVGDGTDFEFVVIPERVAIVRRIFDESMAGLGKRVVAATLNRDGIPAFRGNNGWHHSSIHKIIRNEATIGIFNPGRMEDGKRVIEGDPIREYYPSIISDELFWRVQEAVKGRQRASAGRKGTAFANLLSGLGTCLPCGAGLVFVNKGASRKGGQYLVCGKARRGLCSNHTHYSYPKLESTLLVYLPTLDYSAIIKPASAVVDRTPAIEAEIAAKTAVIDSLVLQFEIAPEATRKAVDRRLRVLGTEIGELEDQLSDARRNTRINEVLSRGNRLTTFAESPLTVFASFFASRCQLAIITSPRRSSSTR
jgi:hypothetical protein